MLYLGCHLSSTKGNAAMVRTAEKIGANTFAYFTRNPRGSKTKPLDLPDCEKAMALLRAGSFGPLVAHGSYTMNLCTADPEARDFASDVLLEDLSRMAALPGQLYNFHPGCHVGQGTEAAIDQIAKALRRALEPGYPVTVLLESMAGKGTEVGKTFEELRDIIQAVGSPELGVCLDTCHIWDGGYDIVEDLEGVLAEFDRTVGLHRLKAMHLNDSKNPRGSHKDRHACIGQGYIGLDAFAAIVNHPALRGKPMILETPNELPGYQAEISLLRSLERESESL